MYPADGDSIDSQRNTVIRNSRDHRGQLAGGSMAGSRDWRASRDAVLGPESKRSCCALSIR
jgi:hypothetical protein